MMSASYKFPSALKAFVSFILLVSTTLLPLSAQAGLELLAMDGQKIVASSAVRIRTEPSLDSTVTGYLSLGAVIPATQRTKEKLQTGGLNGYWYFVESENVEGWVSGNFLQNFQPEKKEQIWFDLIKSRLDNLNLSFQDRVTLYKFTGLVVENAQDEKLKGAFELGRLLALQKSFELVNYENEKKEPYATWAEEHRAADRVFHDEISGQWLVPAMDYWKLADRYEGQRSGDEIAWYAANAQLGGECEGDIACNLEREQITQGEYLRRYPLGRYVNVSLQRLSEVLDYIQTALQEQPNYFREASESGEVIDSLVVLIKGTNPKLSERPKAVGQIKAIQIAFREAQG